MEESFLTIVLDKYDGVPKVTYKGKCLTALVSLSVHWKTADEKGKNLPQVKIVHSEQFKDGYVINKIEHIDICYEDME